MQQTSMTWITLACLAMFLTASGLFILGFRQGRIATLTSMWGHISFALGTLALTVVLASVVISRVEGAQAFPATTTTVWLATTLGWMSIIVWFIWNLRLIGAFTAPLIALVLLVDSFFFTSTLGTAETPSSPLLSVHIISAVIGQTFAIAACGVSLMLLWQEKKLKLRKLGDVPTSFPAMDTLAKALSTTLWVGFTFITVGLLSGSVIAKLYTLPDSFSVAAKSSWAILVWTWYLSILVLQNILSYRPQKIARMSLIGFVLLALSWFGMAFTTQWGHP